MNELRWTPDPDAAFPVNFIAHVTESVWSDPHTNPALRVAALEETLERRSLMQTVTKRGVRQEQHPKQEQDNYAGRTVESVTSLSMVCVKTFSTVAPIFDPSRSTIQHCWPS